MLRFTDVPDANVLWWLDLVATSLSFCGSLWIIFCCFRAPSPKSLSLKLITLIGFADFLYSIANLMSNFQDVGKDFEPDAFDLCALEAILRQISFNLSIFFSTCVAVSSCYSVYFPNGFNKTCFFVLAILIGLITSALYIFEIPELFEDTIVIAEGPFYCWFSYSTLSTSPSPESLSLLLVMVFQGIPVIIGLMIALIAYTLAIRKMKKTSRKLLEAYNINIYRVLWYPAVLFITFVPYVAVAIAKIYDSSSPLWLNALFLYLPHSIGFNDALLYGIQARLYKTHYEEYNKKTADLEEDHENSYAMHSYSKLEERDSIQTALKMLTLIKFCNRCKKFFSSF